MYYLHHSVTKNHLTVVSNHRITDLLSSSFFHLRGYLDTHQIQQHPYELSPVVVDHIIKWKKILPLMGCSPFIV